MTPRYLGLPAGACAWILSKPLVLDSLSALLASPKAQNELAAATLVEGALRLAGSESGNLVVLWNADYMSGRPDEPWGFIAIDEDVGICSTPGIAREVIERAVYVAGQRLNGLMIDGSYIHRSHEHGVHTCLAGRGTAARQWSIGYTEGNFALRAFSVHTVLVCGPRNEFRNLVDVTHSRSKDVPGLLSQTARILEPSERTTEAVGTATAAFRAAIRRYTESSPGPAAPLTEISLGKRVSTEDVYRTALWPYRSWFSKKSPLTSAQRRVLEDFPLDHGPLRITGPAGSGKTLLMQLLALRCLERGRPDGTPARLLYVAHNQSMAAAVRMRFTTLIGQDKGLAERSQNLLTRTLSEHGLAELGLEGKEVIDRDAADAKAFQLDVLSRALDAVVAAEPRIGRGDAPLFDLLAQNREFRIAGLPLVMAEISSAIKGQGIIGDRPRYVLSEKPLSRLHGILNQLDRELLYRVFEAYEQEIRVQWEVLDADDVALSLLGKLNAPVWELRRRTLGYDYVFVDETQLFNENERRVLPLLTSRSDGLVPIALALDEAQDVHGHLYAGLATLGFKNLQSEHLAAVQRSSEDIIKLAFFVIKQTTDLFSADFPDYTGTAQSVVPKTHPQLRFPEVRQLTAPKLDFGDFVARVAGEMRKDGCESVAIVCHADQYVAAVRRGLISSSLPYEELTTRGRRPGDSGVVLTTPAFVGGQEFDGVVIVGLEQGTYPPNVAGSASLRGAVEQTALRETYLSVSRARYRVVFPINRGATANALLAAARQAKVANLEFQKLD